MARILIDLRQANISVGQGKGKRALLHNVDFTLYKGEHCGILGPNGSGKSTFLNVLGGMHWPDTQPTQNDDDREIYEYTLGFPGEHCFDDDQSEMAPPPDLSKINSTKQPVRDRFLWNMYEEDMPDAPKPPSLIIPPIRWYVNGKEETSPIMGRSMTGIVSAAKHERYVRHGWRLSGEDILLTAFSDSELLYFIPEEQQIEAVRIMAEKLSCTHLLRHDAGALSQGQLRLLLLGRILLRSPEVLLLDEYVEGLDSPTRKLILKALEDCGATLVVTGHREGAWPPFLKHYYELIDGELVSIDLRPRALLDAGMPTRCYDTRAQGKPPVYVEEPPRTPTRLYVHEQPHMLVENAQVYINRKHILKDISWRWDWGQRWFLHGANGSGKSAFLRLLAGDEYVAWGGKLERYALRGQEPISLNDRTAINRAVRLVSDREQMTYSYDISGFELVLSGLDSVQGVHREYTDAEKEIARKLLERLGLTFRAVKPMSEMSTGLMRCFMTARALIGEPEILLLDEPFSGLDLVSRWDMRDIIEEMSLDTAIILVSHFEEDKLDCINCEAIMENGQLRVLRQDA